MSWKGSISRMSDECLITLETVFSFYTQYQAVMRKFTLAGKTHDCHHQDRTDSNILPLQAYGLPIFVSLHDLRHSLFRYLLQTYYLLQQKNRSLVLSIYA